MWLKIDYFYKTALYTAIENYNIEIIKLLLTNANLDINIYNRINKNWNNEITKHI